MVSYFNTLFSNKKLRSVAHGAPALAADWVAAPRRQAACPVPRPASLPDDRTGEAPLRAADRLPDVALTTPHPPLGRLQSSCLADAPNDQASKLARLHSWLTNDAASAIEPFGTSTPAPATPSAPSPRHGDAAAAATRLAVARLAAQVSEGSSWIEARGLAHLARLRGVTLQIFRSDDAAAPSRRQRRGLHLAEQFNLGGRKEVVNLLFDGQSYALLQEVSKISAGRAHGRPIMQPPDGDSLFHAVAEATDPAVSWVSQLHRSGQLDLLRERCPALRRLLPDLDALTNDELYYEFKSMAADDLRGDLARAIANSA